MGDNLYGKVGPNWKVPGLSTDDVAAPEAVAEVAEVVVVPVVAPVVPAAPVVQVVEAVIPQAAPKTSADPVE